jgi:restriction system protein
MPIPDFQTLMLPVLEAAARGEVRIADLTDNLANAFGLTPEERSTLLPSGRQMTLANRIGWAKTYLAKAGLVESKRRGYFNATERGREILAQHLNRIDIALLSRFPEFEQFKRASRKEQSDDSDISIVVEASNQTPDELLMATHQAIENSLRNDLLDRLIKASPSFFESTIVTLLLSMGYGGSREEAGRAIGRSGDGGVDGVVDQDPLGLDRVYVQAKRYQAAVAIGEPEIRGFAGSLQGVKATKGVFVTTSYFTPQAKAFAEKIERRIVLIDGELLAQLMIKHDVGVRIQQTIHIKKIDEDFFTSD